ncbi:MAG TPA: GNAT family N-acetyltransferase [Candidatus Nanoarchaeia archaeon]|nr:GNAT family N-acetyltransferase [Candidatus Nanoarchaeia archaeon]
MLELIVDDELRLREFSPSDASAIFSLIDQNRDHLSQHGEDTAAKYPTQESVLTSIQAPKNPLKLRFGIWAGDTFVGSVNLHPDGSGRSAEIGYYLGSEFMKRGYVTRSVRRLIQYGFEELGVQEVWAKVAKSNEPSIPVLIKTEFSEDNSRSDDRDLYFSIKRS